MYLQRRSVCALAFCAVLLSATITNASDSLENAALGYWQAFAILPSTDKEQDKILVKAVEAKLDDRAKSLIKQSEAARQCLHRAAAVPACDWGLQWEAGLQMQMPHISEARDMARFACLHARNDVEAGRPDAALQVLGDTLVLARHVGQDNTGIALLVQHAIEQWVVQVSARELLGFETEQLNALEKRLESLPKGATLQGTIKTEQEVFVGCARRLVREAGSDAEAVKVLCDTFVGGDDWTKALAGATRDQIVTWLDGTWQDYDQIIAILDAPVAVFRPRWNALLKRVKVDNPFSAMVLPTVERIREKRDHSAAKWALFKAAIVVVRDGTDSLRDIKDPFGAGPFKYEKTAGGFRLSSQLTVKEKQVELVVGHGG